MSNLSNFYHKDGLHGQESFTPSFNNFLYHIHNKNWSTCYNMYPSLSLSDEEKSKASNELNRIGATSKWDFMDGEACRKLISMVKKQNKKPTKLSWSKPVPDCSPELDFRRNSNIKKIDWIDTFAIALISTLLLHSAYLYWNIDIVTSIILTLVITLILGLKKYNQIHKARHN